MGFDNHCFLISWGPSLMHRWEVLNLLLRNSRCFWSREETTWGYLLSPITLSIESSKQGLLRDPEASFKMVRPCYSDKSSLFFILSHLTIWASQVALVVKNLPTGAGDMKDTVLIPESGRSPGGGHGNPLQYSCLENPTDRGAWRAAVRHGVAKSQTQPKWLCTHAYLVISIPQIWLGELYTFFTSSLLIILGSTVNSMRIHSLTIFPDSFFTTMTGEAYGLWSSNDHVNQQLF